MYIYKYIYLYIYMIGQYFGAVCFKIVLAQLKCIHIL